MRCCLLLYFRGWPLPFLDFAATHSSVLPLWRLLLLLLPPLPLLGVVLSHALLFVFVFFLPFLFYVPPFSLSFGVFECTFPRVVTDLVSYGLQRRQLTPDAFDSSRKEKVQQNRHPPIFCVSDVSESRRRHILSAPRGTLFL